MNPNKKNRKRRGRIFFCLYALLILLSLFSVATYTWFSLSKTPQVNDMAMYVNTPTGLELSADPVAGEWVRQLDFGQLLGEHEPLRPITWSAADQRFYAAIYGMDGRITNQWEPLDDSFNANKNDSNGYYIVGTFYARCDQKVTVSLSPAVEVEEGLQGSGTYVIGTPVWDGQSVLHDNGGRGAELAVRLGFLIQKTDLNGQPLDKPAEFYIYEPNSDTHIEGENGYVDTPSIDGSDTLVPRDHMILQTTSRWSEAYPVERDVVIRSLGEFTSDAELFELLPGELAQISLYIWLEGQDVDCTNMIGREAQILASVQFAAETDGQSGLVPIE